MTTSEPSRLDRIERILENVAEQQQLFQSQIEQTRQIADSNARAIQAHGEELRTSLAAHREELTSSLAAHRQEFRNNISDVVNMVGEIANPVAENNAQIEVLIGESRENAKQHQLFQERFDRMLAEIQQIWQRIGANGRRE